MSGDGLVRPLNAPAGGTPLPGVQAGVSNGVVVANKIIVIGDNGEILFYNGPIQANDLLLSIVPSDSSDNAGNQIPAGISTFTPGAPGVGQNQSFEGIYSAITNADGTGSQQGAWDQDSDFWNDATVFYSSVPVVTQDPNAAPDTPETWHDLTPHLINGWTVGANGIARIMKGSNNRVYLDLVNLTPGTLSQGTGIFSIPTGYYNPSWTTTKNIPIGVVATGAQTNTPFLAARSSAQITLENFPTGVTSVFSSDFSYPLD